MLRNVLLSLLFVVSGCGARTELHAIGDAGAPRDAGSPVRDAAVPHACVLRTSEPITVLEHPRGTFDQPEVTVRSSGAIDLVARRIGGSPSESEVLARGARVRDDHTLELVTSSVRLFGPSIWNRAGALDDTLGTCSTLGGPTDLTEIRTWSTSYDEVGRTMPIAALACHDLVGRGDRWLFVTRGIAEGTVVTERRLDGRMVQGPANAFDPAVGANVSVTEIDDGFAWVGVLDVEGRTQVVIRDDAGNDARRDFFLSHRTGGAKPTIGRGLASGSAAVAYYDDDELFVRLVDRASVGAPSVALAFSMSPDADPAVARVAGHLLVASLDYGDADPTRGALNLAMLAPGLAVVDMHAEPTVRDELLRTGGVAIDVLDDVAVVHWVEGDPSGGDAGRTRALTVWCE